MFTLDLTLPLIGWFVLAGAALSGAAVSALSGDSQRRDGGLLGVVLSVAGLLMILGVDIAALVWLGVGAVLVRLPGAFDRTDDRTHRSSEPRPTRRARPLRLFAGLPAIILGILLVTVVSTVGWRALPPPQQTAGSAEVGGRLLTMDLALLLGMGLLLGAVLVAAAWILLPSRSTHEREGS